MKWMIVAMLVLDATLLTMAHWRPRFESVLQDIATAWGNLTAALGDVWDRRGSIPQDLWDGLVNSVTNSTQGPVMHAAWLFVASMTLVMTSIAVARMVPSLKSHRVRQVVEPQKRVVQEILAAARRTSAD